jgi:hypothetical protein
MRRGACAVLAALSLGCAAYLAWARYPIGLDFEGGAMFVLKDDDPGAALQALHAAGADRFTIEKKRVMAPGMTQAQADRFLARVPVEYSSVIVSSFPPFYGRPLAAAIALLAAAAWLLSIWRPAMMVVAGGALAFAIVVATHGAIGGTLSRRIYYKGALFALPACILCAWLAHRSRRTSAHRAK